MDALTQIILKEIPETVTTSLILEYVPRFLKEAETLTIPGAEKKQAVLKALQTLVHLLKDTEKLNDELANELLMFIDTTLNKSIDILVEAYNGTLRMPQTVEEVTQRANCLLGCIGSIVRMAQVKNVPAVPAAVPAPVPVPAPAVLVPEAAPAPEATPVNAQV